MHNSNFSLIVYSALLSVIRLLVAMQSGLKDPVQASLSLKQTRKGWKSVVLIAVGPASQLPRLRQRPPLGATVNY